MDWIFRLIGDWKDLITKVFTNSPVAAAIATLVAIGVFYLLQTRWRKDKTTTNAMMVLIGWAVAVPLLGFVGSVLAKIWEAVEFLASGTIKFVGSMYGIYARHPLLLIGVIVVAVAAYFVWRRWLPNRHPKGFLRVGSIVATAIVVTYIADPLIDLFATTTASASEVKPKSP
jgi:hypothetical protein